ncbi:hypothetical protein [Cupriavidus sp. AcVe19-6a]|uniref:hypothetical protein n=1 Tax=Cupriavidus sp. AcVe19-6a TaxID=2821358 RepID=UPI001AE6D80C|nr:hypothetical protein [Cupriavidus sp. AcVe19-6a]MBP0639107.1 hypothetical protein [Cupriavidus sp. AcVe19-6a]
MARSIRVFYTNMQGVVRINFNWPPINIRSALLVTAAEWQSGPLGPMLDGTHRPLLGAAPIWVSNVGAHGHGEEAGGVEFLLHVDWHVPLNIMVTITVLDDIEDFVRA